MAELANFEIKNRVAGMLQNPNRSGVTSPAVSDDVKRPRVHSYGRIAVLADKMRRILTNRVQCYIG
jgi:hypothetical protein